MKNLLFCFEYLKRYHSDIKVALSIILQAILLNQKENEMIKNLIAKGNKRKNIRLEYEVLLEAYLRQNIKDLSNFEIAKLNQNANLLKVLKLINIACSGTKNQAILLLEDFLYIITQKKTKNLLFEYSTPIEIDKLSLELLDIKNNELIYNPCCGIGTIFLALKHKELDIYAEELDSNLAYIARLICLMKNIKNTNIKVNNILTNPIFIEENEELYKFDKVICNPPTSVHLGVDGLKSDIRFVDIKLLKLYPELAFIFSGLKHIKYMGVFIIRSQLVPKLIKILEPMNLYIYSIVELPKNIFARSKFNQIIISIKSKNSGGTNFDKILCIKADNEEFYKLDGKRKRLINVENILNLYRNRDEIINNQISQKHTEIIDLNLSNQRVNIKNSFETMGFTIIRNTSLNELSGDEEYFDFGINDFATCGFSEKISTAKSTTNAKTVAKLRLKPYDILLSLRGKNPKIAIMGKIADKKTIIANAGILTIRHIEPRLNLNFYCYLFVNNNLFKLYEDGLLDVKKLLNLKMPDSIKNGDKINAKYFDTLCKLNKNIEANYKKLEKLKGGMI